MKRPADMWSGSIASWLVVMVTIGLPGSWKSGTPQLVHVTRQPRVDRSPRRDPLFERCRANGAPHCLQTKPTHAS